MAKATSFDFALLFVTIFFKKKKRNNCFADAAFQIGIVDESNRPSESSTNITFSVGSVLFLNGSVGFERAIHYDILTDNGAMQKSRHYFSH